MASKNKAAPPPPAVKIWTHQLTHGETLIPYATVLKPAGARAHERAYVEIQEVEYDDVQAAVVEDDEFDADDAAGGNARVLTFRGVRVAVGDCVLLYNEDNVAAAPFVARVAGMALAPRRELPARGAPDDPGRVLRATGDPADALWVAKQERLGRVPARHVRLRLQYFYRYPDLLDAWRVLDTPASTPGGGGGGGGGGAFDGSGGGGGGSGGDGGALVAELFDRLGAAMKQVGVAPPDPEREREGRQLERVARYVSERKRESGSRGVWA